MSLPGKQKKITVVPQEAPERERRINVDPIEKPGRRSDPVPSSPEPVAPDREKVPA